MDMRLAPKQDIRGCSVIYSFLKITFLGNFWGLINAANTRFETILPNNVSQKIKRFPEKRENALNFTQS